MKFEPVTDGVGEMLQRLRQEHFPGLANAKILLLANRKKMQRRGLLCLGRIYKPSELNRYLSRDEAPDDGYDYIILLDGKLLAHGEENDIERVLRHGHWRLHHARNHHRHGGRPPGPGFHSAGPGS